MIRDGSYNIGDPAIHVGSSTPLTIRYRSGVLDMGDLL